jgi:hypothetical protein
MPAVANSSPPQTGQEDVFRRPVRQRGGQRLQHLVARIVAMRVVDALEIVDVSDGAGENVRAAMGAGQQLPCPREEGAAIRQAGQLVMIGQPVIRFGRPGGALSGRALNADAAGRRDEKRKDDAGDVDVAAC